MEFPGLMNYIYSPIFQVASIFFDYFKIYFANTQRYLSRPSNKKASPVLARLLFEARSCRELGGGDDRAAPAPFNPVRQVEAQSGMIGETNGHRKGKRDDNTGSTCRNVRKSYAAAAQLARL